MNKLVKVAATGLVAIAASTSSQATAQSSNAPPNSVDAVDRQIKAQAQNDAFKRSEELVRRGIEKGAETVGFKLGKDELRAVKKIEAALAAKNYEGAAAAVAAASATVKTPDGRYAVAALQLQLGTETKNETLQDQAIDAALATGAAPQSLLPELYRRQGVAAILAKNYVKAEAALSKVVELTPQDADSVVLLAEAKNRANKPDEALPLFEKAISLRTAANQPVPAEWSRAMGVMKAKMQVKR